MRQVGQRAIFWPVPLFDGVFTISGAPAVDEFYDFKYYWSQESLERRRALRAGKPGSQGEDDSA